MMRRPHACSTPAPTTRTRCSHASLAADDCHACDPTWSTDDHDGHGTEMAGLALFGDLGDAMLGGGPVRLRHRLESVKFLPPPPGANSAGALRRGHCDGGQPRRDRAPAPTRASSRSRSRPTGRPARRRHRGMFGQPTSWSAAIDALAAGLEIESTDDGPGVPRRGRNWRPSSLRHLCRQRRRLRGRPPRPQRSRTDRGPGAGMERPDGRRVHRPDRRKQRAWLRRLDAGRPTR